ncbi:MAG: YihY/virulence factor BrkB family protein [Anditalea sp.]
MIISKLKSAWDITKETLRKFQKSKPIVYSAAIAFFTIFSLPPMLIIIIQVAGRFLGEQAVRSEITSQIQTLINQKNADQINEILQNSDGSESGTLATIIGVAGLLFSATIVFNFIQKALNSIWCVKPKPKRSIVKFIVDRLLSFTMVVALGLLLLVFLIIDAILIIFRDYINEKLFGYTGHLMQVLNFLIPLLVVTFIFAMIFKILPDAKIKWKDVRVGAFVTALLFTLGKYIIGLILGNTNIASTYGAAGSLAAILLWVFYSTIIMLLGAEFTKVNTERRGRRIRPKKHAVLVEVKEVSYEDQGNNNQNIK